VSRCIERRKLTCQQCETQCPDLAHSSWLPAHLCALLALYLAYPLFSLLLRTPWANRFFTHATLTHYYRRYHEPETKIEDLE
jgi:hypothetical protein